MAEAIAALGLIATIAQLVDFSGKLITRLIEYQSSVNGSQKIFKGLETNLPLINDTLKRISIHAESGDMDEDTQKALVPVVASCFAQTKSLDYILSNLVPRASDTMLKRGLKAVLSVRQEKEIEKGIKTLKEHLEVLIFHSTACSGSKVESKEDLVKKVSMVPFERDPMYLVRADIMREVHQMLEVQNRVVLTGMGGVGKSQIAIERCYWFQEQYPDGHVFWVHVSTYERALSGWYQIARHLELPGFDKPEADILQMVNDYLNDDIHGRWLLVLDNADDADTFFGSPGNVSTQGNRSSKNLVSYLPRSKKGSTIITTRDKRVGEKLATRKTLIVVPPLTTKEALELLRSRLPDHDQDEANATKLVTELGYLPLAITQAAAFISQNSTTISQYLDSLCADEAEVKELLGEEMYDLRRDQDIQASVLRTWKLSFDIIKNQKPRAIEILSLMAVLDPQGIPKFLLQKPSESAVGFTLAVGVLQAFSLITAERGGVAFGLHRLVQLSIQAWLEHEGCLMQSRSEVLDLLVKQFPEGTFEQWGTCEVLYPHVQAILRCTFTTDASRLQRAQLLGAAAFYDREQGRYDDAYKKFLEEQEIIETVLGKEHPNLMNSLTEMGIVQEKMGRYVLAEDAHRKALNLRIKVLGEEHPDTLQSLSYLAGSLWWQGKYVAAKEHQQRALELRKKVLGEEHADTLSTLSDLAVVLENLGEVDEAVQVHRQTLASQEKALGEAHAESVESMRKLGSALEKAGKHKEAKAMFRRSWTLREESLGSHHPRTLESLEYVAGSLWYQGDYAAAETLLRQALKIRIDTLTDEHPDTLLSMKKLAGILNSQGKHEAALILHEQVVDARSRRLGKEHPDTLESMTDLANVLKSQRKLKACETMHRQILAIRVRTLGKDHPQTLASMDQIVGALWAQELFPEMLEMQERVLQARIEVQGLNHPDTLASMNNVVGSMTHDLAVREAAYGKGDEKTLVRMTRLAYLVRIQGRKKEALALYQKALGIYEKVLGADHPTTKECRECVTETENECP